MAEGSRPPFFVWNPSIHPSDLFVTHFCSNLNSTPLLQSRHMWLLDKQILDIHIFFFFQTTRSQLPRIWLPFFFSVVQTWDLEEGEEGWGCGRGRQRVETLRDGSCRWWEFGWIAGGVRGKLMLAGDGGESLGESGRGAMPCSAPAAGSGMLSAVNDGAEITFPVMKSDGSGGRKKKQKERKKLLLWL